MYYNTPELDEDEGRLQCENEHEFINCVVKPTALAVGYKTRPSDLRK